MEEEKFTGQNLVQNKKMLHSDVIPADAGTSFLRRQEPGGGVSLFLFS
jgi:hypothetical protein